MKLKLLIVCFAFMSSFSVRAQKVDQEGKINVEALMDEFKRMDSIEKTFTYQQGLIQLPNGVAKLNVPKGFKYLDATQSKRVLVDLWGNPENDNVSLGLLLPDSQGVMSFNGFVFNIQYDEIGFVEDNDASDINYEELLAEMQKDMEAENT